jgi:hypothetical protein
MTRGAYHGYCADGKLEGSVAGDGMMSDVRTRITPTFAWFVLALSAVALSVLTPQRHPGVKVSAGRHGIWVGYEEGRAVVWTIRIGLGWGYAYYRYMERAVDRSAGPFGWTSDGREAAVWCPAWIPVATVLIPLCWWTWRWHRVRPGQGVGFPVEMKESAIGGEGISS